MTATRPTAPEPSAGTVPETAIVFGGSGFIGTHLVDHLTGVGTRVVVADIDRPGSLPAGATFEYCDVRQPITIERERPFDHVYHLAAVHRTPGHEPHEYYETNVSGAANLVDWLETGGESVVVFTSSISVYGPSEALKSEALEPEPASDYGRSKLISETILRSWRSRDPSRRLAITRPAVVFGPGEGGNFTRLARALRNRTFFYPGRIDTIKSCGYVADLVRALLFCAARDEPELLFNYCYPHRPTIQEICDTFHVVAGYERPREIPPALIGGVMRLLRLVNPNDRGNINAARVAKLTASTNIAVEKLQALGFEWETDLESGLRRWQRVSGTFL